MTRFVYNEAMDSFIRENHLLTAPELAIRFNNEFYSNRTSQQLHSARKARGLKTGRTGLFFKGQPRPEGSGTKGPTSTSFKKGSRPKNAVPVGSEAITNDGYLKVKIAEPHYWEFKHRLVWESQNGTIPESHVIWFEDQDKQNCSIGNLALIPRTLQVRYNQLRLAGYGDDIQPTLKLIAKLKHRTGELVKEEDKS